MRRASVCMAVGLAVLFGFVSQAAAQAPPGDSVTGDLVDNVPPWIVNVDAHSGAAGENPTGTATWFIGGGFEAFRGGSVTCLAVDGDTAVIGFSGGETLHGIARPIAGLVRVIDGGGPGSGRDSFEWAQVIGQADGEPIPGPTDCSSYPAGFPPGGGLVFNRAGGDLVVTDASPLPTTKEQCKNGGWRTYGVFKNQGDCVSFVGKNSPPS